MGILHFLGLVRTEDKKKPRKEEEFQVATNLTLLTDGEPDCQEHGHCGGSSD